MSTRQEDEGKAGAPNSKSAEDGATPSKADLVRLKLKLVGHYAMLGFAPIVAIAALGVAIISVSGNKSGQEQVSMAVVKIDGLNASLAASKAELDKLKLAMLKEKTLQNDELAKQNERVAKIIQNITPLQVKLKIAPTLEEQLRQPASAAVVAPAAMPPVSAVTTAPTAHHAPSVVVTPAPHRAASAVAATAKATDKSTSADKPLSPQVKAMKEAIELYNKQK